MLFPYMKLLLCFNYNCNLTILYISNQKKIFRKIF